MKKSLRVLCVVCIFTLLLIMALPLNILSASSSSRESVPTVTCTEEPAQPNRYIHVKTTLTQLGISSGTAKMSGKLVGTPGTTTKVEITITLQKKGFLGIWSKVDGWFTSVNGYTATLQPTKAVGSGTYRIKVDYKAYAAVGNEAFTEYSAQVTY